MITSEWVYWFIGLIFLGYGAFAFADIPTSKRYGTAAFWILLGLSFGYGTFVTAGTAPAWVLGIVVLILTALVGTGQLVTDPGKGPTPEQQRAGADRFGNKLFVPALVIPVVAVLFSTAIAAIMIGKTPLLATGTQTLTGLAVAGIIGALVGMWMFKVRNPIVPLREGKRLAYAIGWALVLPQMLATLGTLFQTAGVGTALGKIIKVIVPSNSLFGAVVVYCVGMMLFTLIMGNAFAAFPIMTAAIGYPVLVLAFHGNPAPIFAIGMLSGYCGTLMTPMAANFNLVPAALLETRSKYEVIRAQIPTALVLLVCNILIMWWVAF